MTKREDMPTFMTTLATLDLDIDELERRLELAAAMPATRDWCTSLLGCNGNCSVDRGY